MKSPETITYTRNSNGYRKEETVDLFVGMGATMGIGSDCYPYTVWDWRVTKGGKLIISVTNDSYKAVLKVPYGSDCEYIYTSNEPTETNPVLEVNLSERNCKFYVGGRRYYYDPSF